jgi:predicted transcriptional regulator
MSKRNGKKPKSIAVHIRLRPKTVSAVDKQARLHMSTRSRVAGAAIEKVYGV